MSTEALQAGPRRRLVAVVGPTAAGKSKLGLELAVRCELPVLTCDSVQVYRHLDIGSAKPGPEERARARHELIDLVEPDEGFSAGDWDRAASEQLDLGDGLIVGGTGFYLRSLLWSHSGAEDDLPPDHPDRAAFDATWEAREREEAGAIHRALQSTDPETAAQVHPNNAVRALRALWLCERHGEPVSAVRRRHPPRLRFDALLLNVDPGVAEVDARIDLRCARMIAAGWLAEVEMLRGRGYDARHKSMRSLGYQQLLEHLEGHRSLDEATADIVKATRAYARRQRTFIRTQFSSATRVDLGSADHLDARAREALADRVRRFLAEGETEAAAVKSREHQ